MANLRPGFRFDISGFEIAAMIDCAVGTTPGNQEVLVMHNNSTHFHVAIHGKDEITSAVMVESFYYGDEGGHGVEKQYAAALMRAVIAAMLH